MKPKILMAAFLVMTLAFIILFGSYLRQYNTTEAAIEGWTGCVEILRTIKEEHE